MIQPFVSAASTLLPRFSFVLKVEFIDSLCRRCPEVALDQYGQHALTCRKGPDVCRQHNALRNCVAGYCRRALLNPILEAGAGFGDQTRPADILVPSWNLGKDAALDVTVVNPLNNTNIEGAITAPGSVTAGASNKKHANNDQKCRDSGMCPNSGDNVRRVGGRGRFLDRLFNRVVMETATGKAEAKHAMYTRLNCSLMRKRY